MPALRSGAATIKTTKAGKIGAGKNNSIIPKPIQQKSEATTSAYSTT
jgi:hypothetical protein